jgi:hypothetical protein
MLINEQGPGALGPQTPSWGDGPAHGAARPGLSLQLPDWVAPQERRHLRETQLWLPIAQLVPTSNSLLAEPQSEPWWRFYGCRYEMLLLSTVFSIHTPC